MMALGHFSKTKAVNPKPKGFRGLRFRVGVSGVVGILVDQADTSGDSGV